MVTLVLSGCGASLGVDFDESGPAPKGPDAGPSSEPSPIADRPDVESPDAGGSGPDAAGESPDGAVRTEHDSGAPACDDGETEAAACGVCRERRRVCVEGRWSEYGSCEDVGTCTPGAMQTRTDGCGAGEERSRACTDACAWSTWGACTPVACREGETRNETCGRCGTRSRSCAGGAWGTWSACTDEGACTPGDVQAETSTCGPGEQRRRRCESTCAWGSYSECAPPPCEDSAVESRACGRCGTQRRICSAGVWSTWSACDGQGACVPGESRSDVCEAGGTRTVRCSARCAWDDGEICAPVRPTVALTRDGTCALGTGGAVHCFGNNEGERLGFAATDVVGPRPVRGVPNAQAIVASRVGTSSTPHVCALADGAVYCWGGNQASKLGLGDVNGRTSATKIDALGAGVVQLALGDDHTCARDPLRGILCFGDNAYRQVNSGNARSVATPTINPEVGTRNFWIAAGAHHTCVVRETNRPMCWGSGQSGEIGDGRQDATNRPTVVGGAAVSVTRMALGFRSTFAVLSDGAVAAWGLNSSNQLGDGDIENRALPALVTALGSDNVDVVAGNVYACALKRNGSVFCWGTGASGELGQGSLNPVRQPTRIDALGTDVIEIVAGDAHTCVRKRDGSLWCWGRNNFGQSNGADPSASPLHTPTRIPLP